jgi:hypothetical protein
MSQKTMMLITSTWGENKTFRLIPIENNCPFVEAIYDPEGGVLVLISNVKKQSLHMLAKLDEQGDPVKLKKPRANFKPYPEERKTIETFQEYYVAEKSEIKEIINMFAINADSFDYSSTLAGVVKPEEKKLQLIQP